MQFHEFLEIHLLRAFLRGIWGNDDDWGINVIFLKIKCAFSYVFF